MSDIDEIPVESVSGRRPGTATGDRLVVGLAVLALLGGLFIAASNVLGPLMADPSAARSPGPSTAASDEAGRTPRPSRTERPLREVTLIPDEPPPAPTVGFVPYLIEALTELTVRSSPSDTASVQDRLEPGQVILGEPAPDAADWFAVLEGAEGGFVRAVTGDTPLARTSTVSEGHLSGGISGIAAGPSGFVAHGWRPSSAYEAPGGLTLHSTDGASWTLNDPSIQPGWGGWAAAWGPSGWLAVTSLDEGTGVVSPWVWESPDGDRWTPVGRLPVAGEGYVAGLVANGDGYLLALGSPRVERGVLWFSPDGLTWRESGATGLSSSSGDPYVGPGGTGLLAVPDGFLTWIETDFAPAPPEIAFSPTGQRWQALPLDFRAVSLLEVTAVDGRVLAFGLNDQGTTVTWSGAISEAGLQMVPSPSDRLAFDGAVVTALATDGERAFAFGYERATHSIRAWLGDGIGWRRLPVPSGGFGTIPRVAAAGPRGVVVAGLERSAVASSPLLWHLGDDGHWVPEARPAIPGIPEPRAADCPPRPTTAYELLSVDSGVALACFGDARLTLVAWSAPCGECWGAVRPSRRSPADWLKGYPPFLLLLPWEGDGIRPWGGQALIHPDLRWREEWVGTWVSVTGHYDDPAAAACGSGVEIGAEGWWEGPESEVLTCRRRFVVTAVEVLGRSRG